MIDERLHDERATLPRASTGPRFRRGQTLSQRDVIVPLRIWLRQPAGREAGRRVLRDRNVITLASGGERPARRSGLPRERSPRPINRSATRDSVAKSSAKADRAIHPIRRC
jgi:hypothetical protein